MRLTGSSARSTPTAAATQAPMTNVPSKPSAVQHALVEHLLDRDRDQQLAGGDRDREERG